MPVEREVEALLDAYYRAIEAGAPLDGFYAHDATAGALAPVVKIGSGRGELFVGSDAVVSAVRRVTASYSENRLEQRGPRVVRVSGELALFADAVWWSGNDGDKRFGSLTRWTGVCLRTGDGWRFLQLHVSEEVE